MSAFAQLQRQLKRPHIILLLFAIVGLLVLPRFGPSEIKFHHLLPACANNVAVRAFAGEELVRSSSHALNGQRELEHGFLLPKGSYRLEVEVECQKGAPALLEEKVVHEKADSLDFDLSKKCSC